MRLLKRITQSITNAIQSIITRVKRAIFKRKVRKAIKAMMQSTVDYNNAVYIPHSHIVASQVIIYLAMVSMVI